MYLFERQPKREHEWGEGQKEAEGEGEEAADSPPSREPYLQGPIPGPRDHDPSPRQKLNPRQTLNQLSHPDAWPSLIVLPRTTLSLVQRKEDLSL